ncbi:MAG TPA: transporter substrate-binding domain-containing protein [Petrotogaceae bacterium]|nr:transporter substrate-binding domain-containing protein [Petrotogaceae bacterium]
MRLKYFILGYIFLSATFLWAFEKINVAVTPAYVPYVLEIEQGKLSGLSIDLWNEWEKQTGIEVEFVPVTLKEGLAMLKNNEIDVMDGIFYNLERDAYIDFSKPYDNVDAAIFFGNMITSLNSASSLKGFTVGAVESDFAVNYLQTNGIQTVIEYPTNEALVKAAISGEIKVFVADMPAVLYYLNKYESLDLFKISEPLYTEKVRRGVPQGRQDLLQVVEDGFAKIPSKKVQDILKKWKGQTDPSNIMRQILYIGMIACGIIFAVFLLWSYFLKRLVNLKTKELNEKNHELTYANNELMAINKELEHSFEQIEELSEKFEDLINMASVAFFDTINKDETFFKRLLETAMRIIPESDYGSISLVDGDQWTFVAAVGHDLEKLRLIPLKKSYLVFFCEPVIVEKLRDQNKELPDGIYQRIEEASMPVRYSLIAPLVVNGEYLGNIDLDIDEKSEKAFSKDSIKILKAFSNIANAFLTFKRYSDVRSSFQKEVITSMVNILEVHDEYTKGHSSNVAEIALNIAKKMMMSQEDMEKIFWAGLLHDIGKILIPTDILNKPAKLTYQEYEEVKKHPTYGYDILSKSKNLREIADIVLYHHERYDGNGYPNKVKGADIPLLSRIICVADSIDAMYSKRSYRKPFTWEQINQELKDNAARQFDPDIIEVVLKMSKEEIFK